MDTEAGFSMKSEPVKRQTAAGTRPEEDRECEVEIHDAWNVLGHRGRAGIQGLHEGFRLAFKAWSGFRWRGGKQRATEVDDSLITIYSSKKVRAERKVRFLQSNESVQGTTMLTHCIIF